MSLKAITEISAERRKTDHVMPLWLPFVPFFLYFFTYFVPLGRLVLRPLGQGRPTEPTSLEENFVLLATLVVLALSMYILYRWIDRRNRHVDRTNRLYKACADLFEEKGLGETASNLRKSVSRLEDEIKPKRSPEGILGEFGFIALLIIASEEFVPGGLLSGLIFFTVATLVYVFHFLNKDLHKHDSIEQTIWTDIDKGLRESGKPLASFRGSGVDIFPSRRTAVYAIVSFVTIGIFLIYWFYSLTKDPNVHFKSHSKLEDELVERLKEL